MGIDMREGCKYYFDPRSTDGVRRIILKVTYDLVAQANDSVGNPFPPP